MTDCLFCSFVSGAITPDIVCETPTTLAFRDINPQAPTHVLIVPKAHYATAAELAVAEPTVMADVISTAAAVAADEGLDNGYRLVLNTGADAGQSVFHVHCHLLGGRYLEWPPG
ncbi:MAG: histidine triad nucleotide-binding protein [Nocardioidaceae bacterium]|nr:MAG: histidine triad nucleotide-binding protein [Nocardioidaceae bacterium]